MRFTKKNSYFSRRRSSYQETIPGKKTLRKKAAELLDRYLL